MRKDSSPIPLCYKPARGLDDLARACLTYRSLERYSRRQTSKTAEGKKLSSQNLPTGFF